MAHRTSRRDLLRAGVAGFPLVVASSVLGKDGAVAPSNRIGIGLIGTGRQAYHANLPFFLQWAGTQVVAVCDVDAWRMEQARARVETHYAEAERAGAYKGCFAAKDFREVLARKDVDAVMISTPDHWHVYQAIEAAKAGKDVALEKPLTLSVAEGRALSDAMTKRGRIFRTDTEVRYSKFFQRACEYVRNGRIGKVRHVEVGVPKENKPLGRRPAAMPVPPELDYELWQGPAPEAPYTVERVHPVKDNAGRPGWMQVRATSLGMILNWGAHLLDVAQWGLDTERTGPVSVAGKGVYPKDDLHDVLQDFDVTYEYANGVTLHYTMAGRPFVRFEGTDGWIEAQWWKHLLSEPKTIVKEELPEGSLRLPLISEKEDFVNSVRNRKPTMIDAEIGHRTATMAQIAVIAIDLGRKLKWDPKAERFENDDEANRRLSRPMRGPWQLRA